MEDQDQVVGEGAGQGVPGWRVDRLAEIDARDLDAQRGMERGDQGAQRRMVILYGVPQTPTQEERYQTRTDENGRFRFPSLLPGPYMVTDTVAGQRNWRLRIEVQQGQAATLDLTPANSIKTRDDFPNQG